MQIVKDLSGREWQLHMKLGHARIVQAKLGIDLLSAETAEQSIVKVLSSPMSLFEILWILCEREAKERNISREEFEDGFDGAMYLEAEKRLNDEIVFFIQSVAPAQAKLWIALLKKAKKMSEIHVLKWEQFLDNPEIDKLMEKEVEEVMTEAMSFLREAGGSASTNLREHLNSIHSNSP